MSEINRRKTLLLVDDNAVNLKILTKILKDEYDIFTADNGKTALDILDSASANSIAAVVLDIMMPVMDGYEVLGCLRADKRFAQMPVIVVSGQDSGGDDNKEIRALSLGANDYLTKPYKPEIIKHRIANTIYLRETAAFVNTVQWDSLTGLYSKEYFYLQVEETLQNSQQKKYDMVCCDFERFKLVNDLYGTGIGDELLKQSAQIFKEYVGGEGICGRIGADIFAFFITHQETYNSKCFAKVSEKINHLHNNLNIQLKYGICVIDDPSVSVNLLCDRAQLAIAAIKGKYGVYYKYYDDTIRKKMVDEQHITSRMKQGLENREFEVYFQPKYELKTETIIGAEALVRWNDPQKGFLSPADFIPLFEKNGFITELDQYVWEVCCQRIRAWIDRGNIAIPVSVNVSRADIYNPNLVKIFAAMLEKYSLSPKYLYLEITESAYTENSQQLVEAISKLKQMGFKIEMDDFGTGYSSLNMLSELPIDVVKLDIGFLQNQEKFNNRSVLSFIISLAKWMNLGVIAEGAETVEQINLLRSLGCECVQGYYYAKPMPINQFEELLLKQFEKCSLNRTIPLDEGDNHKVKIYHSSSIMVVDKLNSETEVLNRMFADKYEILSVGSCEDAIEIMEQSQIDIVIVLCTYDSSESAEPFSELLGRCQQYEIPAMAMLLSTDYIDEVMTVGFADYIVKPYHEKAMKNHIECMIGNALRSQLEIEKEINAAILEMKKRAEQDSLTGLLNRAEFENKIQGFFRNTESPDGYFMMLDVDDFKSINDSFGHTTGDNALQAVAGSLHYLFPETDMIGRMGGDEFAVFIPYKEKLEELKIRVKKLCHALDFQVDKMRMSCSVGICVCPENGSKFQTLYENADTALLYAKRHGKSQYRFYEHSMEVTMDEQMEKKAAMLLDNISDAMFVCDAVTSELIYINDTACRLINKSKISCLGARCYQLFWDRCKNCDYCYSVGKSTECFYEEDTLMKDGKTKIHIKAKVDEWDGRRVKIHYLYVLPGQGENAR